MCASICCIYICVVCGCEYECESVYVLYKASRALDFTASTSDPATQSDSSLAAPATHAPTAY